MDKPTLYTAEYYNYISDLMVRAESKLPIHIYGGTGWKLSFCWLDENGEQFPEPCIIPVSVLERLIK